jgi:aspartyl-tRNA(Asn)/glutamyl-tRNA(Gln) amidotransferase subunit A
VLYLKIEFMDLNFLTIKNSIKGLKEKKFSSVELTKACLNRINILERKLSAFVTVTSEIALEGARKADSALASGVEDSLLGIPFAIKDNFCTNGIRTSASSNVLRDFVPPYDATVVAKLKQSGIIILGKTNMDAWAHGSSTETSDFGTTKNPWDLHKLPGGSSGGAAASIAADEVIGSIVWNSGSQTYLRKGVSLRLDCYGFILGLPGAFNKNSRRFSIDP